jgi:peptide-methionine (S)-S-oxide reductase
VNRLQIFLFTVKNSKMKKYLLLFFGVLMLMMNGCAQNPGKKEKQREKSPTGVVRINDYIKGKNLDKYSVATFAGGCFWCTEASFDRLNGVVAVISGYTGGSFDYPTYEEVCAENTGHAEAVNIYFDPAIISFENLLKVFFVAHDPTTLNRQGPDRGESYRSAIFYHGMEQKQSAEKYINELTATKRFYSPIVTEVTEAKEFWVAEAYHQNYYPQNPYQPYILNVSKPKVEKVEKTFSTWLKEKRSN